VSESNGSAAAKARLFELYSGNGYVNAFLHIRWWHANLERIAEFVPRSGTILDLGCGYGITSNYLALLSSDRKVIGIELSDRKLKYARKNLPNVEFKNEDVTRLTLPACKAVLLSDVLHHLRSFEEQENLLRECVKLLDHDGVILVKEIDKKPAHKFFVTQIVDNLLYPGDRFYFRGEDEFKELLGRLNLSVEFHPIHKGKPLSHVMYVARKNPAPSPDS